MDGDLFTAASSTCKRVIERIRDSQRLFRKYNPSLASLSPTTPVGAVVPSRASEVLQC